MEIILISGLFGGLIGYSIGNKKGQPGAGFFLGLLLGPIGWLIIALSKDKNKKPCPFCKEPTHKDATVCSHCQKELSK